MSDESDQMERVANILMNTLVVSDIVDNDPPNITDALFALANAVHELSLQHESLVRAVKDLK